MIIGGNGCSICNMKHTIVKHNWQTSPCFLSRDSCDIAESNLSTKGILAWNQGGKKPGRALSVGPT